MNWNDHHKLEGLHAFLGASQFHWIKWNDQVLAQRYLTQYSQQLGTVLHELASDCIKAKIKLNENDKHLVEFTLYRNRIPKAGFNLDMILSNMIGFVNDAIGFRMDSEVILFYDINCFGTADAIMYDEKKKILRIHDLKTGSTPTHMEQLLIYSALFCLEYHKDPTKFNTELRIYQSPEVIVYNPKPEEILKFMEIITSRVKLLKQINENEGI